MLPYSAIITRRAALDVEDICVYYRKLKPSVEAKFIAATKSAIDRIKNMPRLGSVVEIERPAKETIYSCSIRQFPRYVLFYRVLEHTIEIVRILHGSRNWQELLEQDE